MLSSALKLSLCFVTMLNFFVGLPTSFAGVFHKLLDNASFLHLHWLIVVNRFSDAFLDALKLVAFDFHVNCKIVNEICSPDEMLRISRFFGHLQDLLVVGEDASAVAADDSLPLGRLFLALWLSEFERLQGPDVASDLFDPILNRDILFLSHSPSRHGRWRSLGRLVNDSWFSNWGAVEEGILGAQGAVVGLIPLLDFHSLLSYLEFLLPGWRGPHEV